MKPIGVVARQVVAQLQVNPKAKPPTPRAIRVVVRQSPLLSLPVTPPTHPYVNAWWQRGRKRPTKASLVARADYNRRTQSDE